MELSRHEILDEIPRGALKQLCKVSALNRDADDTYPVSIQAIQEVQEKGDDLRKAIASDKKALSLVRKISMESKLRFTKAKFGYHLRSNLAW